MKQFLDKAEGTEPAAYKSPGKQACEDEKAQNIHGNSVFCAALHRLHCANGAGAQRTGAGIAVQSRHTDIFQLSPVNLTFQKALHMGIGGKSE